MSTTHTTPSPPPGGAMTPTSSTPSATTTTSSSSTTTPIPTSSTSKQRDWKFKPQNPGDGPNSPYRRKRRNSAPAHSVEAFVLHWKYDPKAAEKNRGPSKLHLQEGCQGQGQGLSTASGAGRIPPSSTGSSNGPMSPSTSSRAMAAVMRRAAPYDRRRSLPFIHDPNNTGEQLAPSHLLKPTSREAEDLATAQQLLAQTLSLPPNTPPASLSQLLYAQQYQQLQSALFTLQQQQQQQLSQQQVEPQYPLQPQALPVNREGNAAPSALPPLSHLLNSLRIDEGSKPSAFNPVNPSPLNPNHTANGQLNNPIHAQDPAVTLQTITALINTLQQSNSASPNPVPLPSHLLHDPSAMAIHNILSGGGPPPPPSLPMTSAYLDPQSSSTTLPMTTPSSSQGPSAFTSVPAESKMSINNLLQ